MNSFPRRHPLTVTLFKALADGTRIRLLRLLIKHEM